jgi:hypothetical protein
VEIKTIERIYQDGPANIRFVQSTAVLMWRADSLLLSPPHNTYLSTHYALAPTVFPVLATRFAFFLLSPTISLSTHQFCQLLLSLFSLSPIYGQLASRVFMEFV